jgi:hypothetical protein
LFLAPIVHYLYFSSANIRKKIIRSPFLSKKVLFLLELIHKGCETWNIIIAPDCSLG